MDLEKEKLQNQRDEYLQSLVDFANKLPLTKLQKINFVKDMVQNKETAFVNKKEELENKDDEKEMPLFISADGVKKYADEKTSYQSVGD